ncbi:MAG: hypothetical protein MJE77_36565 [Proteobacteria bacterium]|nr:hypothetical protein [Pseudomonadota bacterium]
MIVVEARFELFDAKMARTLRYKPMTSGIEDWSQPAGGWKYLWRGLLVSRQVIQEGRL